VIHALELLLKELVDLVGNESLIIAVDGFLALRVLNEHLHEANSLEQLT